MARIGARRDTGKLYFDFRWAGCRRREQTALDDTPENRKRAERVLRSLTVDIERGNFNYGDYFPNSRAVLEVCEREEARKALRETTEDLRKDDPATPLFRDFAEIWFIENEVRWRRTTRSTMRMIMDKNLLPQFGDAEIGSIKRADVLGFRAELAKRKGRQANGLLSPKTVNDTIGVLRNILTEAAARHGFTNPCQSMRRLKVPKADVFPFTLDETRRLIATCRADFRDYLIVRAFTGMRTGEANGLKWPCVDFERREILVRETFTHGEQDLTKTSASVREIVMSPPVHEALLRLHAKAADKQGYVFANANGQPLDNHNFANRVWYPLLRLLGFRRRRPYQLRHTCATLWLTAGENPLWVARQLGHSNVEMLFRVYARWVKDVTRNDGSAFERLLDESQHTKDGKEEAK